MKKPWPKLSETLTGPKELEACQSCGAVAGPDHRWEGKPLILWRECDEADEPTGILVCLCQRCSDRIIEPHPRLYSALAHNEPAPGAMAHLCGGCTFRSGISCQHPKSKWNGGPGMEIIIEPPSRGFACGGKGGCRQLTFYSKPATACKGMTAKVNPSTRRQMSLEDWRAEGKRRFGDRVRNWKFKCVHCGTVQSGQDFLDIGQNPEEIVKVLGFSCIGRWSAGKGCDWTLGGLFQLHTLETVDEKGVASPVFEFAETEEAS